MRSWKFWEWLTYWIVGIAAVMVAFDQAIKLSPSALERLKWLIDSPWWAFAPITLFILSLVIIFIRRASRKNTPSTSVPTEEAESVNKLAPLLSSDLQNLKNEEIRGLAYLVNGRAIDLQRRHSNRYLEIDQSKKLSPDQKALSEMQLDTDSSNEFRSQQLADLLKVAQELQRRVDPKTAMRTTFKPGLITIGEIVVAGDDLVRMAKKLP